MMVTFTRLLVMSIVASVRSESSLSERILWSGSCLESSSSLMSEGESEKKAISDPDANPERTSKIQANAAAIHTPAVGVIN